LYRFWKIIILLGFLWPLPARAAFDLEPRVLVREEFTDNLFLTPSDEESDFITTLAPGITLHYDARLLALDLDYSLHFLDYLHHNDKDETSLRDTQRVQFRGVVRPGKEFSLTILDEYQRVTIDDRRQVADDNSFVNKSNRNRLVVNPEYRCRRFATFVPTVGYRFEKLDYDEPEGDDSEGHEFYTDLEKQLNTKVTFVLGYRHSLYQARQEEDHKRQDLTGRIDYRFGPSLTLRVGGGSAWIDYEVRRDERAMTWDVALDWQPETRWQAGISYSEDFALSVNQGLSKSRRAEAFLRYQERLSWELGLYAEKEDYRTEDREDRSAGIDLRVGLPLSNRFSLDLFADGSLWRFLPEDEDELRYGAGLALNYLIKYGQLSAGYRYRQSDSDLDENDYRNSVVFVQATIKF
jgi:hypothetical protein